MGAWTAKPMRPRLYAGLAVLLVAASCWMLLSHADADQNRVAAAQRIALNIWGPVCGGQPVQISRGDLPLSASGNESLARSFYNFPAGHDDDPGSYFNCRIVYKRGHIPWPKFCSATGHEYGHLKGWRAPPGGAYIRADGTVDRFHSNDPRNLMYPHYVHELSACHRARDTPGRQRAAHESVLVLLLPGGGWQNADPATMAPWVHDFAAHGIRAHAITYPLRDVPAATEYVRQVAAAEAGPVVAYGISAGGTIAAALAATGDVAGAVNIAGPTDFTRWVTPAGITIMRQIGMRTMAQKRAASPYWRLNGRQAPQLVQCGVADPLVEYTQCVRYASAAFKAQPDTRLMAMANAHAQSSRDRILAREWIAARWPVGGEGPGSASREPGPPPQ